MNGSKIDDSNEVFKLVNSIADYTQVYARLGCGHIVNAGGNKVKRSWPCPKECPSGESKSTKFRLHKDFHINGKCIHNDVNNGHYMGIIDYVRWMYRLDAIDAAMEVLDAAGIHYVDLRKGSSRPRMNSNATPVPTLSPEVVAKRKRKHYENGEKAIKRISKMWSEAVPISDPNAQVLLDKYMQSRGLPVGHAAKMPKHLRVHFNLSYPSYLRDDDQKVWYAGLLIPMKDETGKRCTIHRHYFQKDTGERIPEDKKKLMMEGPWSPAPGSYLEYEEPLSYMLEDQTKVAIVQVGEGMETMEAVRAATNVPVQPMFSDHYLSSFIPPEIEGVKPENYYVYFYEDKDRSGAGTRAVTAAIERLEPLGYQCHRLVPPLEIPEGAKSVDWLDVWNELGVMAFPEDLRDPDLEDQVS